MQSPERVILYAVADYALDEHQTIETFLTRQEAGCALDPELADELGWAGRCREARRSES